MKFRLAGVIAALTLLMLGPVSVSAQANPSNLSIADNGTLSNGRQVATIEVAFDCASLFNSGHYEVHVRIIQPSGRTLAEGEGSLADYCVGGARVTTDVDVTTLSSPFKPGPATVIVDVDRNPVDGNADESHVSATVKFKGK